MRQLLIRILIILVMCGFIISIVPAADKTQTKQTTSTQTTTKEASPLDIIKNATEKNTITFQKKFFYDSKGKSDPMFMPWRFINESSGSTETGRDITEQEISSLPDGIDKQLTGVVWSMYKPTALIGDKIVREGDEIAHVKVLKINKGEVIFLYAGKKFPVKVNS